METQYQIKENGFDEIKKKIILRVVPIALIAMIGGLTINHFTTNGQSSNMNVLPFLIPFIIVIMALGIRKAVKRQKDIFNSYKLIIDNQKIIRQQHLTPDIEIPLEEIKEIIKNKNGTFIIKGEKLSNTISIPSQLEKIDEVEVKLAEITKIIQNDKKPFLQRFFWVIPILTVGLLMIVYISENKILVGFSTIVLILGAIYSLISTQRSKHVDSKTKKGIWFIILVLFSVITVSYIKLFGN